MATTKTKFTVGLFVLIGITIAVVAIIWLGMSHYFEKGRHYVAYFDESVQGLDKDSPVKYRGVSIGRVYSIGVAPDANLIQVELKIETGLDLEGDFVAQIKAVGITGIMFIEIDRKKKDEPDLSPKIAFAPKHPVISTKPSDIHKIIQGLDEIITQMKLLDFTGISNKLKSALDNMDQSVKDAQIAELSSGIRTSLRRLQKILEPGKWDQLIDSVENAGISVTSLATNADETVFRLNDAIVRIDNMVADNEKYLSEAFKNFQSSMKNADIFLSRGTDLIRDADTKVSIVQRRLVATLQGIEKVTENLNQLIDRLSAQPSELLFGQPPPARNVEPEKTGPP
ncbi:MAG TPA: MlaD family protein [Desulfobacterales bacterium]|nr:MlaD family protein [Desulfobacterales bacterium]